jgi:tetratricopeptide (TPR) repeat protein
MTGQRELAMKNVRAMVAELPAKFVKENAGFADGFFAVPLEVLVRFGRWDEILKEPDKYPNGMPFVRAFHHAARATAFAAKGDTANARKEQTLFVEGAKLAPPETQLGNNSAAAVISLATHMLEGEILVAEKSVDAGIAELQTAVKEEDALKYDEPPAWMIPVRHSLGAVLMKAGRYADAEQVYRADLAKLPDNGWSLYGLADSLREQKKSEDEAAAVNTKFTKTWAKADTKIATSCLCQAKK